MPMLTYGRIKTMDKVVLEKLLMEAEKIKKASLININNLLGLISKTYSQEKENVIKKYDLNLTDKFNIFETISDLYKREKFHSDILYTILNPSTPEIGNVASLTFVSKFIEMLDLDYKFIIDNTIKISKEEDNSVWDGHEEKKGYIDLLIINNHNQAIIIENKLNYAPDQPNQIVRYMKYIQEQKFEKSSNVDMTVVYLTLVPGKIPDIDNYHSSFEDYTKLIIDAKNGNDGKVLKYRSAVDSNKKKGSLIKFLDECLLYLDSKNPANSEVMLTKVYLEQYKILLGHLGGNEAMLEYQKELLKNIYSSEKNYKAAKDLVEVFEYDKNDMLGLLITEQLKDIVEPLGFCFKSWEYSKWGYYIFTKDISSNYLYVSGIGGQLQLGFRTNNKIFKQRHKIYQNILEDIYKLETKLEDDIWIYLDIEPLNGKENLNKFLEFYTSLLVEVKKRF